LVVLAISNVWLDLVVCYYPKPYGGHASMVIYGCSQ
jgi:hypothetical protein